MVMKKTAFLIFVFLFSSMLIFSQRRTQTVKWISFALKGGVGNSYFLNTDHLNDPNVELNLFSLSHSVGGRLTFTYGDHLGLGSDVLLSAYNEKYSIRNEAANVSYEKNIKLSTLDIVPFFRYTGYNTAYVELGAKISKINSVFEENTVQENFNPLELEMLEPKFTGAIFGFGLALYKTDRLDINLGARLSYAFTDLSPNRDIINDGFFIPDYTVNSATNPLSFQALLEVNYFFAFWGDAKCGRGRLMFFQ